MALAGCFSSVFEPNYTLGIKGKNTTGDPGAGAIPETLSPAGPAPTAQWAAADPDDELVTLTWTEPADSGFDHVEITWTPADGTPVTPQTPSRGTGQPLTISGLTNGTAYTFTLKTVYTDGTISAGTSIVATPTDGSGGPPPFVAVTNITGVPSTTIVGTPLTLTGTVDPVNATNKTIVWSLKTQGGTSSTIIGDVLTAAAPGTVTVTATIVDGTAVGTAYTQDFDITAPPIGETTLVADPGFELIALTWAEPADSGFAAVEISWTPATGTPVTPQTVLKGAAQPLTIRGLTNGTNYTFTVKTKDTIGNLSAGVSVTAAPIATKDLTIKFDKRTLGVPLTTQIISDTFTSVHNAVSGGDFSRIDLGDYIDLPELTIGAKTITDQALIYQSVDKGRLLRLMVVGKNSFKRGGGAVNNPTAPDHVVFHFQNVPVRQKMLAGSPLGKTYMESSLRTYLVNKFLPGLKAATGLTNAMLWAPIHKVAGLGADGLETIDDMLWLPNFREMMGVLYSYPVTWNYLSDEESNADHAQLEYYQDNPSRIKYDVVGSLVPYQYWLASPIFGPSKSLGQHFFSVYTDGSSGSAAHFFDFNGGCVPAFCVR